MTFDVADLALSLYILPMNLSQIKKDSQFEVIEVTTDELRERLLEMGVYRGLKGRLVKHLPFGGPVILQAGESLFAVRREDAQWIEIQELQSL